jgi:hypothetical protein
MGVLTRPRLVRQGNSRGFQYGGYERARTRKSGGVIPVTHSISMISVVKLEWRNLYTFYFHIRSFRTYLNCGKNWRIITTYVSTWLQMWRTCPRNPTRFGRVVLYQEYQRPLLNSKWRRIFWTSVIGWLAINWQI